MAVFCQFFYIVYQAIKLPLYFVFASQAEAVQSFVGADVAEDRFYNGHPVAVDLFAVRAVYAIMDRVELELAGRDQLFGLGFAGYLVAFAVFLFLVSELGITAAELVTGYWLSEM
tara:strand:+ start:3209 stop:3553 length:345 start_codon:yes stop_codon:yes gene_type:complete